MRDSLTSHKNTAYSNLDTLFLAFKRINHATQHKHVHCKHITNNAIIVTFLFSACLYKYFKAIFYMYVLMNDCTLGTVIITHTGQLR